jgi:O-antigen/teichoic acid export membrane protein
VLALVFYLLRGPLGEALFGTAGYATVVALIALSLVLNQLTGFSREILRFRFMPVPYLVSSFISAIVGGLLGVAAVLTLDGGVEDVLWGAAIGLALAAVYGFWKLRGVLAPEVSRPELRRMLAFGLPLIPAALSLWAVSFIDRLLLQHLSSLAVVGEYAIANRVSSVVLFGVTAFGLAFAPFALDLHTRDARQERLIRAQAMNAFVTGLAALAVVLALFAREIVAVVAPAFDTAYRSAGLLCLGVLLYGIATLVMLEMTIVRRTGIIAVAALLATVVNVGANLLLIPPLGAVGAALATAGAYAVMALYAWHRAQRIERVNYDTRFIAELLLLGSACGAAGLLPEGPEWLAAKAAALGVFAAFLWLRGALRPRVLRSVLASLRPSAGEEAA